jgi:hypothetical protein
LVTRTKNEKIRLIFRSADIFTIITTIEGTNAANGENICNIIYFLTKKGKIEIN